MLSTRVRTVAAIAALVGAFALTARPVVAAPTPQAGQAPRPAASRQPAPENQVVVDNPDAQRTRDAFIQLLDRYPPALGRVLKLDPSLLSKSDYLQPYPALTAFLSQHPEIVRNPAFFLEPISGNVGNVYRPDPTTQAYQMWEEVMAGLAGITVAIIILTTLAWIVRTLVDYRRWYRLSKVQSEAHSKLLDRMTSNEELLAYVQSPAGSKFLQSAPIALDPGTRAIGAPFGRILWSIQAGLVLAAGGFGLQYVSSHVMPDAGQPVFAMGVLALALGIGFVLSAVVSYVLSRRLGLFDQTGSTPPGERRVTPTT